MTGTTSIMVSGNAAGMLRNLDSVTYQEGLGQPAVDAPTFPLGDSSGVYVTEDCSYPSLPSESAVLSEDAWIPHVGEGMMMKLETNSLLGVRGERRCRCNRIEWSLYPRNWPESY